MFVSVPVHETIHPFTIKAGAWTAEPLLGGLFAQIAARTYLKNVLCRVSTEDQSL